MTSLTSEPPDGPAPDLVTGAWSDVAPWTVDPDRLAWRRRVPALRWVVRSELPSLVTPGRVPPVGRALTVVGTVAAELAPWALSARGTTSGRAVLARALRRSAESLGPTFIKLGQIISSGEGIFPAELVEEFRRCRDRVPAEAFDRVRAVIEEDLGRPLESVFDRIDRTPLAAASIAQVHAARLVTGEEVVVKVQRPGIGELVRRDLRVMAWLAPFLVGRIPVAALANPPALVELFAETITEELDFRLEADNMVDLAHIFAELGQRSYVVPRPHPDLVTRRVLVMERLDGYAFDDVDAMVSGGIDTTEVLRSGMIGFMEGALLHGVFHGDLHGGNLLVLRDGRVGLLDFGITARFDPLRQNAFLRLVMGATTNDIGFQLAALRDLGALPPDTDLEAVIRDLGLDRPPVDPTQLAPEEVVREIQQIVKALLGYGARLPKELMLYVKNLVFLDGAIARLAPDLDLLAEVGNIAQILAERHGEAIATSIGMDPNDLDVDVRGFQAAFGVDPRTTTSLTYRELQERRDLIRSRVAGKGLLR